MTRDALLMIFLACTLAGPSSVIAAEQRLSDDAAESRLSYNFAWSIAADDRDRVHVVWYDSRVHYRRSPDGGRSWEQEKILSEDAGPQEHPAVAVAGEMVYVAWHDLRNGRPRILLRRSQDGGATWLPQQPLSDHPLGSAHPSIAATESSVHVTWFDQRHGSTEIYTRRSANRGLTWEDEWLVSEVLSESWVATVAALGSSVIVGWVDYRDGNEEEYLRRSSDGGATWDPQVRMTVDDADSWAPSVAISGDTVHFTWFDRRDAGVTDADVESQLNQALALVGQTASPSPPRDPLVYYLPLFLARIDEKQKRVIEAAPAWVHAGGDLKKLEAILKEFERLMTLWSYGWEIYYKRSEDGGRTFSSDTRLTFASGLSMRPSLAVAGEDVHVVWFDGRQEGNIEIFSKRSIDGGRTWGNDERLSDGLGDSAHPTAARWRGSLHVVWFDSRHGPAEIYYRNIALTARRRAVRLSALHPGGSHLNDAHRASPGIVADRRADHLR